MRTALTLTFAALVLMNGALLVSNGILTRNLEILGRSRLEDVANALAAERGHWAAERARFAAKVELLASRLDTRVTATESEKVEPSTEAIADVANAEGRTAESMEGSGGWVKPDVLSMAPMTDDELDALSDAYASLPSMNHRLLLHGNVEDVLADSGWNPTGRSLSPEDAAELDHLIKDYRFFERGSRVERFETWVKPELERLRAAGASVDFQKGEPPPRAATTGVITHVVAHGGGKFTKYFFDPRDYPDMYRYRQVAGEQARLARILIHQLLENDRSPDG